MNSEPVIRRDLWPGDLGAIVRLHGSVYTPEYGVDSTFEGHVAASVARSAINGFPSEREGVWLVEGVGGILGSLGLTDEGDGEGTVRWFVLHPTLRGRGLGRQLVAELMAKAERVGYARLSLETFSELTIAARLYRSYGFELVWSQTGPRWGRDELTYQRYELEMARARESIGTSAAGLRSAV